MFTGNGSAARDGVAKTHAAEVKKVRRVRLMLRFYRHWKILSTTAI
jgi:hypothetical protein